MNYRLSSLVRALDLCRSDFKAAFLWGPRKTGKTTLLRQQFPNAKFYDLLQSDLRTELLIRPSRLRAEVLAQKFPLVIVDEIQKVPDLLDEIHWCLENTKTRFILCGSSARKVRHGHANLLGGRAERYELFPLTTREVGDFDLNRAIHNGLLPEHYLMDHPDKLLKGYVLDYLNEEIRAEALTRNIPAFSRFLDAVALTHGGLVNYANIARDCGVHAKTVREYFQILEDTLLGHTLPPWRRSRKRRMIETAKFYLFDPGLVRTLKGIKSIDEKTDEFGHFFEHFLIEETRACLSYRNSDAPLFFWRTSTGLEVDLVIGNRDVAVEFKSSDRISEFDAKGLRAFLEDGPAKHRLLVCRIEAPRQLDKEILAIPWQVYCQRLWSGDFI